jgi:hypothetical protein
MSVGQKSTKEKFMKKNFIMILVVLFTFSFTFIGCGDKDETDSALGGTWVDVEDKDYEVNYNAGNFTISDAGTPVYMGTYKTDGTKITAEITDMNLAYFEEDPTPLWYKKEGILGLFRLDRINDLFENEAEITALFAPTNSSYFIDGKYLYIYHYDAVTGNLDGDAKFTRKI